MLSINFSQYAGDMEIDLPDIFNLCKQINYFMAVYNSQDTVGFL